MSLKHTSDHDRDPRDEGGEERELQQQLMQDERHRKSPLPSGEQSLRAVLC